MNTSYLEVLLVLSTELVCEQNPIYLQDTVCNNRLLALDLKRPRKKDDRFLLVRFSTCYYEVKRLASQKTDRSRRCGPQIGDQWYRCFIKVVSIVALRCILDTILW